MSVMFERHSFITFICIDVANGYSERFSKYVKEIRKQYPDKVIIAGNVVTGEMTEEKVRAFRLTVAPSSVLHLEMTFKPKYKRTHAFELPLSLIGVESTPALQRVVAAEAVIHPSNNRWHTRFEHMPT